MHRLPRRDLLGNSLAHNTVKKRTEAYKQPQPQSTSECTSYYCRLCSSCSANCRSWSRLSSKSCRAVTFVLTIPQKGISCNNESSSLGESASTIKAIARSPTGKPPTTIFPSDFKFM